MKEATNKPQITVTSEPYKNLFTSSANTKPDLKKQQLLEARGRRRFVFGVRSWSESGERDSMRGQELDRGQRAITLDLLYGGILIVPPLQTATIQLSCAYVFSGSVMSDSLRPPGLQPTRLLCPWNFRNTEVGCHFLLQAIFQTQGLNPPV